MRQETKDGTASTETLLENVDALDFRYGIDCDPVSRDEDGAVDSWEDTSAGIGNRKVVAVRTALRARPAITNPDIKNASPRTLVSTVTFRNLSQMR